MKNSIREPLSDFQESFLRRKHVEARTGLPRSSMYLLISKGTFPKPVKLGVRAVGWPESAIEKWIAERIAQSAVKA